MAFLPPLLFFNLFTPFYRFSFTCCIEFFIITIFIFIEFHPKFLPFSPICHPGRTDSCTSKNNILTCNCLPGYTGPFCSIDIDHCSSQPCSTNHGHCIDGVGSFKCVCETGFQGDFCEEQINNCADSQTCENDGTGWFP